MRRRAKDLGHFGTLRFGIRVYRGVKRIYEGSGFEGGVQVRLESKAPEFRVSGLGSSVWP